MEKTGNKGGGGKGIESKAAQLMWRLGLHEQCLESGAEGCVVRLRYSTVSEQRTDFVK